MLETVLTQNEDFSEAFGDTAKGHELSKDPKTSVYIWLHVGVGHPFGGHKLVHCFVSLSSLKLKLPLRSESLYLG